MRTKVFYVKIGNTSPGDYNQDNKVPAELTKNTGFETSKCIIIPLPSTTPRRYEVKRDAEPNYPLLLCHCVNSIISPPLKKVPLVTSAQIALALNMKQLEIKDQV